MENFDNINRGENKRFTMMKRCLATIKSNIKIAFENPNNSLKDLYDRNLNSKEPEISSIRNSKAARIDVLLLCSFYYYFVLIFHTVQNVA